MQSAMALLALLALATLLYVPLAVFAQDDHTYVSNQSNMDITATITYSFDGNQGFTARTIPSKSYDSDVYSEIECNTGALSNPTPVNVEIWFGNNPNSCEVQVPCDASIVLTSTASYSVDIYVSAYGLINNPQGDSLVTLYF